MRPGTLTTLGVQNSAVWIPDVYLNPFNISLQAVIANAPTYTVEYTNDDVFAPGFNPATANWTAVVGMAAAVASANATLISPVTGIRLRQTAGAAPNGVTLRIVQSGAVG